MKNAVRQKKILVPTDFGPGTENTLRIAKTFAALHDAEIVLLHVNEQPMPMAEFFYNEDLREKRKGMASKKLEEMAQNFDDPSVKISWMLSEGKPYRRILEASEELMTEMIVIGISERHGKEFGMLGSNVLKVVRRANCPVITVTDEVEEAVPSRIVLAVDPKFGVHELRTFLQQYHDSYNPIVDLVTIADRDNVEACEEHLTKQRQALMKQGIKQVETTVLRSGSVSNALLDHMAVSNADMVWMETHGRQGLSNFFLGSVTEDVLVNSSIPVLSLHPKREAVGNGKRYYHPNLPI